MKHDPFTLRVALGKTGTAHGELYLDDGEDYSYRTGQLVWRRFDAAQPRKKTLLISRRDLAASNPGSAVDGVVLHGFDPMNAFAKEIRDVRVERLVVVGLGARPKHVRVEGGKELEWEYVAGVSASEKGTGAASVLTVKDPGVAIVSDWAIVIQV
jgi:mannosyl-oligosaccharide alpha-1,3-glucosidase